MPFQNIFMPEFWATSGSRSSCPCYASFGNCQKKRRLHVLKDGPLNCVFSFTRTKTR